MYLFLGIVTCYLHCSYYIDCRTQLTQGRKVLLTLEMIKKLVHRVCPLVSQVFIISLLIYPTKIENWLLHCMDMAFDFSTKSPVTLSVLE